MDLSRPDIDLPQWRALVRTSFRIIRRQPAGFSIGSRSSMGVLWTGLLFYGLMGVFFAVLVNQTHAAGPAAFLVLSLVSIFIGSSVLVEFGSSIVTADDILILGTRPISSRTYFAARITVVLLFVLMYAAALAGPAEVTFLHRYGIAVGAAWLVAAAAASMATGLAMVLVYTAALRYVSAQRIRSVMGYVQMGLSFVIYGGYGLLLNKLGPMFDVSTLPAWTTLLPPAWFASLVSLAGGEWTPGHWAGGILALLSLVILFTAIGGRISLSYTESILASATDEAAGKRRPGKGGLGLARFLARPEDRAIALLVLKQFRYDTKFKLAVLSIIPITILYLYQGMKGATGLSDPFVNPEGFESSALVYIAVILFPVILKSEIVRSDMYQASWIFHAAPVHKGDLMLAVRNIVSVLFLAPYLTLLALLFLYFWGNAGHVLLHMIVLSLASDIFMQVLSLIAPQLPFSAPRATGQRTAMVTGAMVASPILILGLMAVFTFYLYPSFLTYAGGVIALALLDLLGRVLVKRRTGHAGERLEYGW